MAWPYCWEARTRLQLLSGCTVFARLMLQLITATHSFGHWAAVMRCDRFARSTRENACHGGTDETSASLRMHGARASDASGHHGSTLSDPCTDLACVALPYRWEARMRLRLLSGCTVFARLMLQLITATHSSGHWAAVNRHDHLAWGADYFGQS